MSELIVEWQKPRSDSFNLDTFSTLQSSYHNRLMHSTTALNITGSICCATDFTSNVLRYNSLGLMFEYK